MSQSMPALFVGHGNPMNAILKNGYTDAWASLGKELPRPSAVLAVSAHWYLPGTFVTAMDAPRTIHDFGGFPRELYEFEYPARGDAALARRVQKSFGERTPFASTINCGGWITAPGRSCAIFFPRRTFPWCSSASTNLKRVRFITDSVVSWRRCARKAFRFWEAEISCTICTRTRGAGINRSRTIGRSGLKSARGN